MKKLTLIGIAALALAAPAAAGKAPLMIAGGTKLDPVGKKLTLHAKGTYRITMVRQAPDDNHLVLRIK